jgi:hypothetical protein
MNLAPYDKEFIEKAEEFQQRLKNEAEEWNKKMREISESEVPKSARSNFDNAQNFEKVRWEDLEYVEGPWMEKQLDELFPGWSNDAPPGSLHPSAPIITAHARLLIPDKILMYYGIFPPYRIFTATIHQLVTIKSVKQGGTGNIMQYDQWISLEHNSTSAGTKALKVCINRLCHIGDEVYGRIDKSKPSISQEEKLLELINEYPFMESYIEDDIEKGVVTRKNFDKYLEKRKSHAVKYAKQQTNGEN